MSGLIERLSRLRELCRDADKGRKLNDIDLIREAVEVVATNGADWTPWRADLMALRESIGLMLDRM